MTRMLMGLADGKVALILEVCISQKKTRLNTGCLYRSQKKGVEVKYQGSLSQPKKNPGGLYLRKKQGGGEIWRIVSLSAQLSQQQQQQNYPGLNPGGKKKIILRVIVFNKREDWMSNIIYRHV